MMRGGMFFTADDNGIMKPVYQCLNVECGKLCLIAMYVVHHDCTVHITDVHSHSTSNILNFVCVSLYYYHIR